MPGVPQVWAKRVPGSMYVVLPNDAKVTLCWVTLALVQVIRVPTGTLMERGAKAEL